MPWIEWYNSLAKPVWTPAPATIGLIWQILWCRKEIAEWLIEQAQNNITFIAGIDHGFSFPISYFDRYKLRSWSQFLDDFCRHWPTDDDHTYVDFIRHRENGPPDRTGEPTDFRLTEKWTSSAKSVFKFDVRAP